MEGKLKELNMGAVVLPDLCSYSIISKVIHFVSFLHFAPGKATHKYFIIIPKLVFNFSVLRACGE
jgi:hypothetical protein